jgi:hypothetical protein
VKYRLGIVIALVTSPLALGSPANAKGMSGVTITGAGLDRPIVLGYRTDVLDFPTDSAALDRLMATAPMFGDTAGAYVPARSTDLGPALRLTWSVHWKTTQRVVQDLYPYAPRGPVFHTRAGQPIFDRLTTDEWHQTGPRTLAVLRSVGVPAARELRAARAVMAFARPSIAAGQAMLRW